MKRPEMHPARVLFVDDDLGLRVAAQAVLRRLGHYVALASNGADAVELLETEQFDLLITDLMTPGMNGYELIEYIGTNMVGEARPEIIVTTAAGRRGIEKIPSDAICGAILKPWDLDGFVELIAEAVRKRFPSSA